jgi:hypothetical protein
MAIRIASAIATRKRHSGLSFTQETRVENMIRVSKIPNRARYSSNATVFLTIEVQ